MLGFSSDDGNGYDRPSVDQVTFDQTNPDQTYIEPSVTRRAATLDQTDLDQTYIEPSDSRRAVNFDQTNADQMYIEPSDSRRAVNDDMGKISQVPHDDGYLHEDADDFRRPGGIVPATPAPRNSPAERYRGGFIDRTPSVSSLTAALVEPSRNHRSVWQQEADKWAAARQRGKQRGFDDTTTNVGHEGQHARHQRNEEYGSEGTTLDLERAEEGRVSKRKCKKHQKKEDLEETHGG
jgi:hypothetical protein